MGLLVGLTLPVRIDGALDIGLRHLRSLGPEGLVDRVLPVLFVLGLAAALDRVAFCVELDSALAVEGLASGVDLDSVSALVEIPVGPVFRVLPYGLSVWALDGRGVAHRIPGVCAAGFGVVASLVHNDSSTAIAVVSIGRFGAWIVPSTNAVQVDLPGFRGGPCRYVRALKTRRFNLHRRPGLGRRLGNGRSRGNHPRLLSRAGVEALARRAGGGAGLLALGGVALRAVRGRDLAIRGAFGDSVRSCGDLGLGEVDVLTSDRIGPADLVAQPVGKGGRDLARRDGLGVGERVSASGVADVPGRTIPVACAVGRGLV